MAEGEGESCAAGLGPTLGKRSGSVVGGGPRSGVHHKDCGNQLLGEIRAFILKIDLAQIVALDSTVRMKVTVTICPQTKYGPHAQGS